MPQGNKAIQEVAKEAEETRLREKENTSAFESNRKLYFKGLKVEACLLHKSGTLPNPDTVHTPQGPTSDPDIVKERVHEFFAEELKSVTPDQIPPPP